MHMGQAYELCRISRLYAGYIYEYEYSGLSPDVFYDKVFSSVLADYTTALTSQQQCRSVSY